MTRTIFAITTKIFFFADDTCLTYDHEDLPCRTCQYLINDWSKCNKLSIYTRKYEYRVITNRNVSFDTEISMTDDVL